MSEGRLAILLHSHLPYVRGAGRWPHGEEWVYQNGSSYPSTAG